MYPQALLNHETGSVSHFFKSSHLSCFSYCDPPVLHTKLIPFSGIQMLYTTLVPLFEGCSCWPQIPIWCSKGSCLRIHPCTNCCAPASCTHYWSWQRCCNACSLAWASCFMNKHLSGWRCLQYQGFCPHTEAAGHPFFLVSRATFNIFPIAKKLFLACFLSKALAASCLLLCTYLLIFSLHASSHIILKLPSCLETKLS